MAYPQQVLLAEWYKKFPDPNVPILSDEYKFMYGWVKPTAFPCILLVDEKIDYLDEMNLYLKEFIMKNNI